MIDNAENAEREGGMAAKSRTKALAYGTVAKVLIFLPTLLLLTLLFFTLILGGIRAVIADPLWLIISLLFLVGVPGSLIFAIKGRRLGRHFLDHTQREDPPINSAMRMNIFIICADILIVCLVIFLAIYTVSTFKLGRLYV